MNTDTKHRPIDRAPKALSLASWALFAVLLAVALNAVALGSASLEAGAAFRFYGRIGRGIVLWTLVQFAFIQFFRAILFIVRSAAADRDPRALASAGLLRRAARRIGGDLAGFVRIAAPALLSLLATTAVMSALNRLGSFRLADEKLLALDRLLTGTYPFLAWSGADLPAWLVWITVSSFDLMPTLAMFFALALYYADRRSLYEYVAAFCLVTALSVPVWYAVPALSPHDRFLDNVYGLSVPPDVAEGAAAFKPSEGVRAFLDGMRRDKAEFQGTRNYPTSTIPSSHAAWAALVTLYSWRLDKRLFAAFLFISAFSTLGTFLLAQHYFVDIPAGIALAGLAFAATYFISRAGRSRLLAQQNPGRSE